MTDMNELLKSDNLSFGSTVSDILRCAICRNLPVDTYVGPCGCRYCGECIGDYLSYENRKCPGGQDVCDRFILNSETNVFPDVTFSQHNPSQLTRLIYNVNDKNPTKGVSSIFVFDELDHARQFPSNENVYSETGSCSNIIFELIKNIETEASRRIYDIELKMKQLMAEQKRLAQWIQEQSNNFTVQKNEWIKESTRLWNEVMDLKENQEINDEINKEQTVIRSEKYEKPTNWKMIGDSFEEEANEEFFEETNENITHDFTDFLSLTTHSRFSWKIDGISEKQVQQKILFSDSFDTIDGYRLRLRLDLWTICLCVWIQIVKGENDDRLLWPFDHKIAVKIMDQNSQDAVIERQLSYANAISNRERKAYQKPNSENSCIQAIFEYLHPVKWKKVVKCDNIEILCCVN